MAKQINIAKLNEEWEEHTAQELADKYGVGVSTIYRAKDHEGEFYTPRGGTKKKKKSTRKKAKAKAKTKTKTKAKPKNGVTKHYADEVAIQNIRIFVTPNAAEALKRFCKIRELTDLDQANLLSPIILETIRQIEDPTSAARQRIIAEKVRLADAVLAGGN